MGDRRAFLLRIVALLAVAGGATTGRAIPTIQRAVEQSPRYILNPETGVWFERVKDGVYRAITR